MSNKINNLCLKTVIEIDGTAEVEGGENKKIEVDFTDRRFANRLLKLIHRYKNIEDEIKEKFSKADNIEDEMEKMLMFSDIELEVLEEFKENVNGVFGLNITDKLFGEGCLPSIERYFELFETLTPYVVAAQQMEQDRVNNMKSRYSLERISNKAGS